ncbi:uncharacterized protein LOC134824624 isoform X2 [Bolinopsis microptera]|uniref:uncharacterized protein LOC134824624 isoform X2 n=1 Tax=Bolinopsis microptera TaxID=2820187 RepID=UPI003079B730
MVRDMSTAKSEECVQEPEPDNPNSDPLSLESLDVSSAPLQTSPKTSSGLTEITITGSLLVSTAQIQTSPKASQNLTTPLQAYLKISPDLTENPKTSLNLIVPLQTSPKTSLNLNENPKTSSSTEDPPSYEESLCDGTSWDTNLTWPNTLVNRDELAQIFRVNDYDYSTRGRAFTVSGPAEISAPKYRNIINYFENSLEDMSSIEWSSCSGIQRSALQLQGSHYSCSDIESSHTPITRSSIKAVSKDVIHWEYINDDDPPNYSQIEDNNRESGIAEIRPSSTTGTCIINNNDNRHCDIGGNPADNSHLTKQPSAPSLEQINQPSAPMQRSDSWYRGGPQLGRTVTAPGILEKVDIESADRRQISAPGILQSGRNEARDTEVEEGKTVSFYLGRGQEGGANIEKKGVEAKIYNDASFPGHMKKECKTSETEDSGYGEDGVMSDTTPLRLSEINMKPLDSYDHVISMEKDNSRSNLMSHPEDWENHRLFRTEEPKSGTSCTIWLAILFFLIDLIMIISGALLLILNYHQNVITGFVLLGLGIGMCIPALNYIGGLPTLCAGIQS